MVKIPTDTSGNHKLYAPQTYLIQYPYNSSGPAFRKTPDSMLLTDTYTGLSTKINDGVGGANYLDRHSVMCPYNSFLMTLEVKGTAQTCKTVTYTYYQMYKDNSPISDSRCNTAFTCWMSINKKKGNECPCDSEMPPERRTKQVCTGGTFGYAYKCTQYKTLSRDPVTKLARPVPDSNCNELFTNWEDFGGSNTLIYLDRHNVQCQNYFALRGFALENDQQGHVRYRYLCCEQERNYGPGDSRAPTPVPSFAPSPAPTRYNVLLVSADMPVKSTTRFELSPNINMISTLAKGQGPDCDDTPLAFVQFQNVNGLGGQGYWNYRCANLVPEKIPKAYVKSTPSAWQDVGLGNIYLDRQRIACPDNQFMTAFRPNSDNPSRLRFTYSCTNYDKGPIKYGSCAWKDTGLNDNGNGLIYLDRHVVSCGTSQGLVAFEGFNSNGQFRLNYKCCDASLGIPTAQPTMEPTFEPTNEPVSRPTRFPTFEPTFFPTTVSDDTTPTD